MKTNAIICVSLAGASVLFAASGHSRQPTESEQANATPKLMQAASVTHILFDFADAAAVDQWFATDDRVMGGVSQSRMRFDPSGHAVFEGVMSLERNGGFASVRAQAAAPPVSGITHYLLEVQGDGKRYKLNLQMSGGFNPVSYQASFPTVKGAWTTLAIPINAFAPSFRGRRVADAPALDPAQVVQAGLMISDGQDGAFQLSIRKLSVRADSATLPTLPQI